MLPDDGNSEFKKTYLKEEDIWENIYLDHFP